MSFHVNVMLSYVLLCFLVFCLFRYSLLCLDMLCYGMVCMYTICLLTYTCICNYIWFYIYLLHESPLLVGEIPILRSPPLLLHRQVIGVAGVRERIDCLCPLEITHGTRKSTTLERTDYTTLEWKRIQLYICSCIWFFYRF